MKKVSIIGVGLIGKSLSIRLKKFNFDVHVYTRNISKILDLRDLGINICENIFDCINNADLVVLCLPGDEAIKEVCYSEEFQKANLNTVIDIGTTSPALTLDLYRYFEKNNIRFFDAPFSGGPKDVLEGNIVSLLGCTEKIYKDFKYFFDVITQKVFILNNVAWAQKAKIALNIIKAGIYQVYVEGLILGVKQGLDINLMLDIINNSSAASSISKSKLFNAINNPQTSFSFKNMKKDVRLAFHEIDNKNLSLPLLLKLNDIYSNINIELDIDYTKVILDFNFDNNNLDF